MLIQEVRQSIFHPFEELRPELKAQLQARECENCQDTLWGRMHFILADNGKVAWWHDKC